MAKRKDFYIRIHKQSIPVSEDVYSVYYRMHEHERYQKRRDKQKGIVSLDSSNEMFLFRMHYQSIEDTVISNLTQEALHDSINKLSNLEKELIYALYYQGYSEREWSAFTGIPYTTIHDRKIKALEKLKIFLK